MDGPVKPGHDKLSVLQAHGFLHTLLRGDDGSGAAKETVCPEFCPCHKKTDERALTKTGGRYPAALMVHPSKRTLLLAVSRYRTASYLSGCSKGAAPRKNFVRRNSDPKSSFKPPLTSKSCFRSSATWISRVIGIENWTCPFK